MHIVIRLSMAGIFFWLGVVFDQVIERVESLRHQEVLQKYSWSCSVTGSRHFFKIILNVTIEYLQYILSMQSGHYFVCWAFRNVKIIEEPIFTYKFLNSTEGCHHRIEQFSTQMNITRVTGRSHESMVLKFVYIFACSFTSVHKFHHRSLSKPVKDMKGSRGVTVRHHRSNWQMGRVSSKFQKAAWPTKKSRIMAKKQRVPCFKQNLENLVNFIVCNVMP